MWRYNTLNKKLWLLAENPMLFYKLFKDITWMKISQIFWLDKKLALQYITNKAKNNIFEIININGYRIKIPTNMDSYITINEIYKLDMYSKLKWCKCVLDIWWYIWDSAIYLANCNDEVIVFEPWNEKFKILQDNTKSYKNIKTSNFAVVWNSEWDKFMYDDFSAWAWMLESENWSKINTVKISDILDKNPKIDWIKIDIEWWEYDIIDYFLWNQESFKFKKWYIEFHILDNASFESIKKFTNMLWSIWYITEYIDFKTWKKIKEQDINWVQVFMIYFEK